MNFEKVIVGGLETNCYILKAGQSGIIIDPGADPSRIIKKIKDLKIDLILATHNHFDHLTALRQVKEKTQAQAAIHPLDWTEGFDRKLSDGEKILLGREEILVIHTPGHTPGGCCFLVGGDLFSGDTLFPGGPGNTAFPGGDEQAIYESIREKLMVLPDDTKVHPGHGPSTTIGAERHLY